jgi:nucleotide-binding universal stress UspA family protein
MAQTYGRELNVLSAVDVPVEAYGEAPDYIEKMVDKAQETVEAIKKTAEAAKLHVKSFVRVGDAHEKIIDVATSQKADIICMGSHGRTGIRRLLMGSVTEKVIANAPCPVLVVKS